MIQWLSVNGVTAVICLVLLALAFLALRAMYRRKKNGCCGGGCSGCQSRGNCQGMGR